MPKIIDLFAGAGGLSLGAARAGFEISVAIEKDKHAFETHQKNFSSAKHSDADVSCLSGHRVLELAGLRKGALAGLIGGPPCQGFSNIGQRKANDERNNLFLHFFRLVSELLPKFFLAENVPGIMDERYQTLREKAFKLIKKSYVILPPFEVVASDYGAPTIRKRIFFIGYLPRYFAPLSLDSFAPSQDMTQVYVREALQGLPIEINPDWQSEESGWRPVKSLGSSYFVSRLIGNIPEGVGNPVLIERYTVRREVSGCIGTRHTPSVAERYGALCPGEKDEISKSVRLDPNGFCPTLRAGTDVTRGRYQAVRPIHYMKPRVITPREAARLQGFPDWFVFHRTKWHSFRQIGNSVSPIVAEHLLKTIFQKLTA